MSIGKITMTVITVAFVLFLTGALVDSCVRDAIWTERCQDIGAYDYIVIEGTPHCIGVVDGERVLTPLPSRD